MIARKGLSFGMPGIMPVPGIPTMGGLIPVPVEESCMPHPDDNAMASPKI